MAWWERIVPFRDQRKSVAQPERSLPVTDFVEKARLEAQLGSFRAEIVRLQELTLQHEADAGRFKYLLAQLPAIRPDPLKADQMLIKRVEEMVEVQNRLVAMYHVIFEGGSNADEATGADIEVSSAFYAGNIETKIKELQILIDKGIITQEEGDALVAEWLMQMKHFIELSKPVKQLLLKGLKWIQDGSFGNLE